MPNDKETGRYPNELRAERARACLTRSQVSQLTRQLAAEDGILYVAVSEATLKALELGWSRPRPRTASSIAHALKTSPSLVFTSGIDDSNRKAPSK